MTVDTESLQTLSSGVDQPEPVSFASGEGKLRDASIAVAGRGITLRHSRTIKVHLAVNEIVVGGGTRVTTLVQWRHDYFDRLIIRFVISISQEDWSEINVVICILWAVDDHGPQEAICGDVSSRKGWRMRVTSLNTVPSSVNDTKKYRRDQPGTGR